MSLQIVIPELFSRALLSWYDINRRILPWREDPTPYHVWISEIMLQQTQVQTVLPYYERFIAECPDIAALAALPLDRLRKLWEGLGYYSRARNLQNAAREVMQTYNGQLPDTFECLLSLPGIGPYTAGAIASIAYGKRVCAVDGNVLRILSRISAYEGAVNTARGAAPIREMAQRLVPGDRPGDFNQALMDLGTAVCRANKSPRCSLCPLAESCIAHLSGLTEALPVKKAKSPRKTEEHTIVILTCGNLLFIRKRPEKGLLAGLWEFIDLNGALSEDEIQKSLASLGITSCRLSAMGNSRHIFTHKEWQMTGWLAAIDEMPPLSGGHWVTVNDLNMHYAVAGALSFYKNQLHADPCSASLLSQSGTQHPSSRRILC